MTSDCPFIDPILVDKITNAYKKGNYDYVSNIIFRSFPDGMDTEIFSYKSLSFARNNLNNSFDREHVTKYFLRSDQVKKKKYLFWKKKLSKYKIDIRL